MSLSIEALHEGASPSKSELLHLLSHLDFYYETLIEKAYALRRLHFGHRVYVRGLIEFTNVCKNPCRYCGISTYNKSVPRIRLTETQIIETAKRGYALGFRTFVLQGGEDAYFKDEMLLGILRAIKESCPEAAMTLSIGERTKESYQQYYDAGADRFLLRHECVNPTLYQNLHPGMSLENRIQCLYDLKSIGFQVGSGFMVGVPGQTLSDLCEDLIFLKALNPQMVGIGPFIPHEKTPLKDAPPGSAKLTYALIAILRILLPKALIPATTSLATLNPQNRYAGFRAGANVVMPNLTPYECKASYQLYDGKKIDDTESADALAKLQRETEKEGFCLDMSRGDYPNWRKK